MQSRSRQIGSLNYRIALKFDRHLGHETVVCAVCLSIYSYLAWRCKTWICMTLEFCLFNHFKYLSLTRHQSEPRSCCPNSWVNSLWPSDTIWRQRSGSTLAKVMVWCLTALSHFKNQCWLVIIEVQWHHVNIRAISQEMSQSSVTEICLKITYLKFQSNFPGANEST